MTHRELHDGVMAVWGIDACPDCTGCVFFNPWRTGRPCTALRQIMPAEAETCAARLEDVSTEDLEIRLLWAGYLTRGRDDNGGHEETR